ncbi:hypothetical protein MXAN_4105 [Myxococcus xanthus DK 1622]|uniref:Uncharacterized protein n=1 Tax=Myxococcus xanthus (strain DK1622) TaxID=246197 RepID=Q1D4Z0_MYXXD|nr:MULTISPECIES: hypothetical protein [Myxococcus]ABF92936.1 hypothetical protein MXAN_4105 [Myxococcus xanthus DK 1622]NOJ51470.1 hypothetical protein [Myxococcus xanthus]QPM76719.1 hypothetical protein I5Q59_20330 [Myxococcus xanthus]QVW65785.1 hypothetical protein JTM82_25685 [Myxococcus xanthus DZ2]QZZ51794.1 hypothetical protein MyxoNM_21550 [Myxococcus xanthus]
MGSKKLALEAGGPPRLELSWGWGWKQFTVTLDGKVVGTLNGGAAELKRGVFFTLPDGSSLNVLLLSGVFRTGLAVSRDGEALPGSDTDPSQQVKRAANMLYFLAGVNTLLGVIGLLVESEALEAAGMGLGSILFGVVVAVLGFFTYRGTRAAPILAGILYIADALTTVVDTVTEGGRVPVVALIIRAYIIITLFTAAKAAAELRRREQEGAGVSLQP